VGRLGLFLVLGCASPDWRNADLQIDVTGRTLSDEAQVRICVEGAGEREQAIGAGTMTFPGLPAQGTLRVQVDLLDEEMRLARAGPTLLGEDADYARLSWRDCGSDCSLCEDDGPGAAEGADNRLLAVRFRD